MKGAPPIELEGQAIRLKAQSKASGLGKVLRINDDGSIPDDNPFRSDRGADPALWSPGHRNIQGPAYHPLQGRIWSSEHGAHGGDELNRLVAVGSGRAVAAWKGNLFAGGLVSGDVRRIELGPSGEVLKQSSLPVGKRVRDGALIRLEPAVPALPTLPTGLRQTR
ncbi:MAG: PQQ-dependent sugar dehydrogenase [Cyanobacteria bacterium]|nr:PQQ-dependent sugar dehydrogenase [Cyanobacteriota bacterium]